MCGLSKTLQPNEKLEILILLLCLLTAVLGVFNIGSIKVMNNILIFQLMVVFLLPMGMKCIQTFQWFFLKYMIAMPFIGGGVFHFSMALPNVG